MALSEKELNEIGQQVGDDFLVCIKGNLNSSSYEQGKRRLQEVRRNFKKEPPVFRDMDVVMKSNNQDDIIKYLLDIGWVEDGVSSSNSYKIITQNSYPLAGAIINVGNRPRFKKGDWKVTVGKSTTYFYKPEVNKDRNLWDGFHFNNSSIEDIKLKASE
jgi:hypothetical protein